VTEAFPSREQALHLLRQSGCSRDVIRHSEKVAELAVKIAEACWKNGIDVDLKLVEIGALLHDIGRSKTHNVHHVIAGAKIAESLGLPKPIVSIIKRHVGAGISEDEAERLGWPNDVYMPQTLEEKIVSYADKRIEGLRIVPIQRTIQRFRSKGLPHSTLKRLKGLAREMKDLVGDCKSIL